MQPPPWTEELPHDSSSNHIIKPINITSCSNLRRLGNLTILKSDVVVHYRATANVNPRDGELLRVVGTNLANVTFN